jgi:hypothetical protein
MYLKADQSSQKNIVTRQHPSHGVAMSIPDAPIPPTAGAAKRPGGWRDISMVVYNASHILWLLLLACVCACVCRVVLPRCYQLNPSKRQKENWRAMREEAMQDMISVCTLTTIILLVATGLTSIANAQRGSKRGRHFL